MAEFIEEFNTNEWEVETPSGWQSFSGIGKTISYKVWSIITTNTSLKCADDHILHKHIIGNTYEETLTKNLEVGDFIMGKNCLEEILSIEETDESEEMYDLLNVENGNIYYTNNLVSHNSLTVTSYLLHYILFNKNVSVGILANKAKTAGELLDRLKKSYENLPLWMQQGTVEWNKTSIELENGSKLDVSATSSSAIRGSSRNIIVLDEFAFVSNNIAEEFFTSVYPVITSGTTTKLIIISTPNGMNHFYKIWKDAEDKKNDYVPIAANWYEVPGRDQKFKEQTIKNTSELQWRVEFENEFLGSENTLISPAKLNTLTYKEPITKSADGLDIFEAPEKDHIYSLCADTGRGLEQDYHAFSVIDCTTSPYKLVAKFRNNKISHQVYPSYIKKIADKYNEAYVLLEINDLGQTVAELLHTELEYPNIVMISSDKKGQKANGGFGGRGKSNYGVNMSNSVKTQGCCILKDLVEGEKLIIEDFDIISELGTFINKNTVAGNDKFEASEGNHDDLVTTLVLFSWLTTQPYFKDFTNSDIRKRLYEAQLKKIEEDNSSFGFLEGNFIDEEDTPVDF